MTRTEGIAVVLLAWGASVAVAGAQACPDGTQWDPAQQVCMTVDTGAGPAPSAPTAPGAPGAGTPDTAQPGAQPAPAAPQQQPQQWQQPQQQQQPQQWQQPQQQQPQQWQQPSQPQPTGPTPYGQTGQQPSYGGPAAGQAPPPQRERKSFHGSFHLNVLGGLGFGITPTLEVGGGHFGFLARVRILQAGLANYFIYPDFGDDETLDLSLGFSGGMRFYTAHRDAMSGFYIGGLVEWSFVNVDDYGEGSTEHYELIAAGLDIGYRWCFGSRFLFGLGLWLGYAHFLVAEESTPGGPTFDRSGYDGSPFGALNLDLGVYF